jgi:hypothetical protein
LIVSLQTGEEMRRNQIVAVALVVAAALLTVASTAVAEEAPPTAPPPANCPSGVVCVFTEGYFMGAEGHTVCSAEGAHPFGGWKFSILNHCTSRPVWVRIGGEAKACVPSGGQIENFKFNEIWVGASGGHC